jgi:hypothetical protein
VAGRPATLDARLQRLERANLVYRTVIVGLVFCTMGAGTLSRVTAQNAASLRLRELIIEDAQGRPRIVMQAPIAEGPSSNRVGIRINDPRGVERIGLVVTDAGNAVIGLDAPPGTGDDRNRERVTLVADNLGGANLTFKDRRTSVAARMLLTPSNQVWLQFSDFVAQPPTLRRLGLGVDQTIENPQ